MIEPIGTGDRQTSLYDRYSQYQQYLNPDYQRSIGDFADGRGIAPAQKSAMPQGQENPFSQMNDPSRSRGVGAGSATNQVRECQTCKNRRYQDQSDDPGVSYQTPTAISPDQAGAAVRAHENEHVSREQAKAAKQGREVVSQSVIIKTAICPECGRVYVAGGKTTTVTRAKDKSEQFQAGEKPEPAGKVMDVRV